MKNEQITTVHPLPHEGKTVPKNPEEKIDEAVEKVKNPPETGEAMKKGASTALVNWKDRMVSVKAVAQEAEKPSGGFISFKGGRMTYGDEIIPGDKMNMIIIDYRKENDLYLGKYVAGVNRSPDCYAIVAPNQILTPYYGAPDASGEPTAPSENPQAHECESCPMNEWESVRLIDETSTSRGKACKTSRRVMAIAADDATTPDKIAKAQVVTFIPPATSVDGFSTMMNQITKALDTAHFGAVVEVSVKPHDKFLFMVHFKVVQQITNEALLEALTLKYIKESEKVITYPKNSERDGGPPPKQSTKY